MLLFLLLACGTGTPDDTGVDDTGTDDTGTDDTGDTDLPAATQQVDGVTIQRPAATVPACDDAVFADLFEDLSGWQHARSCAFASVGLSNEDESRTLTLHLDVPDDDALAVGETFAINWDPTAGQFEDETTGWLKLQEGGNLFDPFCNDVMANPPVVAHTWTPIDGYMRLHVTATEGDWEPWGAPFIGKVEIRGVVLKDEGSESTCGIPDLDLVDLELGWLPG